MIDLDSYIDLQNKLKDLISEAKKCKKLSEKVSSMDIGKSYEKANQKLHFNMSSLRKQENRLIKFINDTLPDYDQDLLVRPSSWHEMK